MSNSLDFSRVPHKSFGGNALSFCSKRSFRAHFRRFGTQTYLLAGCFSGEDFVGRIGVSVLLVIGDAAANGLHFLNSSVDEQEQNRNNGGKCGIRRVPLTTTNQCPRAIVLMNVETLRDARQKSGLTQEELAFMAGISERYMRKIEGGSPPSGKVLRSILAVLNEHDVDVSVEDVLPGRHEEVSSKGAEDKRLLTRWFQRVWNEQDLSALDEMMQEDCILTAEGVVTRGREEIRTRVAAIQLAFDSFDFQIETMVSDGQWVVANWVVTKRHVGEFFDIAPTGKTVTVRGNSSVRIENGQIVEGRDRWDIQPMLDLLASTAQSSSKTAGCE